MRCGDKNSRFFHRRASSRKKRNTSRGLFNDAGTWIEGTRAIEEVISSYFVDLFSSSKPSPEVMDFVCEKVVPRVTESMNAKLLQPFTGEEVQRAVFAMNAIKAPGADGFIALFCQQILEYGQGGWSKRCVAG